MIRFFVRLFLLSLSIAIALPAMAQSDFEEVLSRNSKLIQKSSSKTVGPVLEELQNFGSNAAENFLYNWKDKALYFIKDTGQFVYVASFPVSADGKKSAVLRHVETGEALGEVLASTIKQVKPNSGVRAKIAAAMVPFQLASDDAELRAASLAALSRDFQSSHLLPLKKAIEAETLPDLKEQMKRAYIFGVIGYGRDNAEIETAIYSLEGDLSLDVRAALNPLLVSQVLVAKQLPEDVNLARIIIPEKTIKHDDGSAGRQSLMMSNEYELSLAASYDLMAAAGLAPQFITPDMRNKILIAATVDGRIAGIPVASLASEESRNQAYQALVDNGTAPPMVGEAERQKAVASAVFYAVYDNPSAEVTGAARTVLKSINVRVGIYKFLDLVLDGLSLASIYFLAAIGLAITFGVMRVINMAHGEFIMMGAYTGYVIQLFIPNYTLSIIVALPAAFIITFLAGVVMERLVIRHLYKRPLETLLATFGISIALQQIAKNIFGTQARPLTSPAWLDGAFVVNDILSISNIRIAIFCLGLLFLGLLVFVMKRTRFGLDTRAVTQNPAMAASMGINPDRINMLTFGFGSGIAGIAGVAIGLFSKVTSELGSDYIVQSFMTVVVGGVGNIWGTLAGAAMIGSLQKGIEWFNPSNTLAAQTYMIIFIILFIQFRPRGIIALKGRAAEE